MRKPSQNDFTVQVPDVGYFTFARRKMSDEVAIQVEFARIIDGVTPTQWLEIVAGSISALKVLTVRAPEGWDINELDPLDDDSYAKLIAVHSALTSKEQSFRRSKITGSENEGQGTGDNDRVLVQEEV